MSRIAAFLAFACVALVASAARASDGGATEGETVAHVSLLLAVVLVVAKLGGEIATRLKQPPVLGELLAGIALGNVPLPGLSHLGASAAVDMLSQLAVLILLFEVGLQSTVREVLSVGFAAARVAVLGTLGTMAAAWGVTYLVLPGASSLTRLFVAASITATSVGITARVFKDIGQTRSPEARTILGAAVLDDILGLVVLGLVSGWLAAASSGSTGGVSAGALALTVGKTIAFLAIAVVVGVKVTPRIFGIAARLRTGGALLAIGLAFCFFLAWAASTIGLAPLIGAFAAGLVLEDLHSARFVARGEKPLAELVEPISSFLVPVFFVIMGVRADVRAFVRAETLVLAGALTAAAIVGKLACAVGAAKRTNRLAIALGMVPRGEVTLIFASIGASSMVAGVPVLDRSGYSALVLVVVLTTLLTPTALKWSFGRRPASAA